MQTWETSLQTGSQAQEKMLPANLWFFNSVLHKHTEFPSTVITLYWGHQFRITVAVEGGNGLFHCFRHYNKPRTVGWSCMVRSTLQKNECRNLCVQKLELVQNGLSRTETKMIVRSSLIQKLRYSLYLLLLKHLRRHTRALYKFF